MNEPIIFIQVLFGLTVIGTILWFYAACRSSRCLVILIGWAILQSIVGLLGFYQDTETIPPRLMLFAVFPTLILIAAMFLTRSGKAFIDGST